MTVDWGKVLESIDRYNPKVRLGWAVHFSTEQAFRNLVEQKFGESSGTFFGYELEKAMLAHIKKESRVLMRELRREQFER
jgi:hypothetical protein